MMQTLLSEVAKKYPLQELHIGNMSKVKANGMTFSIKAYQAQSLGHVSVMSAKGFFGLMKMDTLIINPTVKDLPLYSYDRIYAMGNDTLIVELYHTLVDECPLSELQTVKDLYKDLPEHTLGSHWYDSIKLPESISKKGKKAQSSRFDELTTKHLAAYLKAAPQSNTSSPEAKQKKASYYVEGLLKNGGPSTDVFKKALGEEKTADLFRKILFGTDTL